MEEARAGHAAATAQAQATARRVHGAPSDEREAPRYAGLVTRLVAFAIDAAIIDLVALLVGAVVALAFSILPGSVQHDTVLVAIAGAVFVVWSVAYFVGFWTTTGQTPGNRVLGIRVVRLDGAHLRPRHALVRLLGIAASTILLLGFVPILLTERRRGLHDWLAGTVVRNVPSGGPAPRAG